MELACHNLWKIFGPAPQRVYQALHAAPGAPPLATTDHLVAVRDVSFTVRAGEAFVIMGLSGSGKSTLLRCLARLIEPTAGSVLFGGRNILQLSAAELRELRRHTVSMVFQQFGLFPHRRVIDNVAYGLEVRGVPRRERYAQANRMLELVGLTGWEAHLPHQLSGGMQQRVGLARALAVEPTILLFDEPFSALDPLIRREMQDELLRLQHTLHKTSVFITHDFSEALRLGERVAVMRQGQIVQIGTPAELVLRPHNAYVAAFVRDAPRARVLTAATVVQPCPPDFAGQGHPTVRPEQPLAELLPLLAADERPVVVRQSDGTILGMVDRQALLRGLVTDTEAVIRE